MKLETVIRRYQEANKDKILEKRIWQQSICAVCGGRYTHCNKSRHERSKTHLNKLKGVANHDEEVDEIIEI
jgi:hypothetical protein